MKKLLKTLSLVLVIIMLFSAVACNNTVDSNAPNNDENSGNTNNGDDSGNNENVTPPDMQIPEGYTVLSSKDLTLPITYANNPRDHKARMAYIKNETNEQALYIDIISKENTLIMTHVITGYSQLFIDADGLMFLVRFSISETNYGEKQARIEYGNYEISDNDWSAGSTETSPAPKFQKIKSTVEFNTFYFSSMSQIDMSRDQCMSLCNKLQNLLKNLSTSYCTLADNLLYPDAPKLYTMEEKTATPDINNLEIRNKYTYDYFIEFAKTLTGIA